MKYLLLHLCRVALLGVVLVAHPLELLSELLDATVRERLEVHSVLVAFYC